MEPIPFAKSLRWKDFLQPILLSKPFLILIIPSLEPVFIKRIISRSKKQFQCLRIRNEKIFSLVGNSENGNGAAEIFRCEEEKSHKTQEVLIW